MGYRVLYRKYRPETFDNLIGQNHVVNILKNSVKDNKLAHAYLFSGPRGTGKTSTARILAKSINCLENVDGMACGKCVNCQSFGSNPDIIEIDAASNNGVDEIRELINNVKIMPTSLKYKVYIIDEVHMLSQSAFNALLLTLEEPPEHVIFILATTNLESVPITIVSRCQRFEFRKISENDIFDRLKYICEEESIKYDDDGLREIALLSEGGLRDALSILDQLSKDDTMITSDLVAKEIGSISNKKIEDLIKALGNSNVDEINQIFEEFQNSGLNYKVLIKKLVNILSRIAVNILKGDNSYKVDFDICRRLIFDLNELINKININVDAYLLIKMIFLGYIELPNLVTKVENSVPEKIDEITKSKEEDVVTTAKKKIIKNSKNNDDYINNLINVRINNCFVNASKSELSSIGKKWNSFVDSLEDAKEKGMILDTNVVAASDSHAIVITQIMHQDLEINKKINIIDEKFSKFMDKDYKLIFIDEKRWDDEKNKYIVNLKGKYKDEMQEEPVKEVINNVVADMVDVFDISKIEIE